MLKRVEEFAQLLRQNGLRLSPAECTDAISALSLVALEEKPLVHAALRSTMVKRASDALLFDRLFELFWSGQKALIDGLSSSLFAGLKNEKLSEKSLEEIAQLLAQTELSPLTKALLEGNSESLARLLQEASLAVDFRNLQSPLQRGFYARRVMGAAGAQQSEAELGQFVQSLRARAVPPGELAVVQRETARTMEALEEAARRVAEREQRLRDPAARGESGLSQRALASLTPHEVERMREAVKRLAERLKERLSRRRRARRKGALSVRRTLRKNLALGGLPAQLIFRTRRRERPEIVVLCDVSDSVRTVSRMMLQFVHTLQSHYARVRSFVFVSEIGEVTQLFKSSDVAAAVDLAMAGRVINLAANSNYGRALEQFHREQFGSINRRTTVLVIGDGRCNYNPPNAWVLDELKRRARRVLWLCPEDRGAWGFGDSEMPLYARHCHRTLSVKSLDDLARAADDLLP